MAGDRTNQGEPVVVGLTHVVKHADHDGTKGHTQIQSREHQSVGDAKELFGDDVAATLDHEATARRTTKLRTSQRSRWS